MKKMNLKQKLVRHVGVERLIRWYPELKGELLELFECRKIGKRYGVVEEKLLDWVRNREMKLTETDCLALMFKYPGIVKHYRRYCQGRGRWT